MKRSQNLRNKLSLLTTVLDYIHVRDWEDHERFGNSVVDLLAESSSQDDFVTRLERQKGHPFFRYNNTSVGEFLNGFPMKAVFRIMGETAQLDNGFVHETYPRLRHLGTKVRRIYLEEIDSFSFVASVSRKSVTNLIPLDVPERSVKELICNILGIRPIPPDWGGERSDLYAEVTYKGRRVPAAFMFKGRGTPGTLTVAKCGKNGDQVIRLVAEPASLFVIQHVSGIDSNVIKLLEMAVKSIAGESRETYYCVIDGVETARLFQAYAKMD